MYNRQYVYRRQDEASKEKNILPTVKHGREPIVMWVCFVSSDTDLDRITEIV